MVFDNYAIYDAATGEVVHLHAEPTELGSAVEEIIRLADPTGERDLRALKISEAEAATGAMRVVDDRLQPADESVGHGSSGASTGFPEPAAAREYEVLRRHREVGD